MSVVKFVLLGEFSHKTNNGLQSYLLRPGFGRMWARDRIQRFHCAEVFGFDNGAYSCFRKQVPFDEVKFLKRLDVAMEQPDNACVCAVAPDIVEGGLESLDFSLSWRERLPDKLPWYLAVQDGMKTSDVEPHISKFDGIFLGGSDSFKQTAATWCTVAHSHEKFFHWGRCSTLNAVLAAWRIGADSIDSARPVIAWTNGERDRARAWLRAAMGNHPQTELFEHE